MIGHLRCCDCKFYYFDDRSPDMCSNPLFKNDFSVPYCDDLNNDGWCIGYDRKWWKIWRPK